MRWFTSELELLLSSHLVMSDSLPPQGLWHDRLPFPSLSPGVCSNSYPMSQGCQPTISFCHTLRYLPSTFPSVRIFSNEAVLCIKSKVFNISPSNEYSRLISFRMNLLQQHSSRVNSSALNFLYGPTLTSIHDYWKNHSFDQMYLCQESNVSAFNMLHRLTELLFQEASVF